MKLASTLRIAFLLLILGSTVGCDQVTKHLARTRLHKHESMVLLGGLGELQLAENPGAFLSVGAALPPAARRAIFTTATGIGMLALFGYLLTCRTVPWQTFAGLALVWAGGTSNLIDRLTRAGNVTDFLQLHCGPLQTGVFNVADLAVMSGLGFVMVGAFKKQKAPRSPAT